MRFAVLSLCLLLAMVTSVPLPPPHFVPLPAIDAMVRTDESESPEPSAGPAFASMSATPMAFTTPYATSSPLTTPIDGSSRILKLVGRQETEITAVPVPIRKDTSQSDNEMTVHHYTASDSESDVDIEMPLETSNTPEPSLEPMVRVPSADEFDLEAMHRELAKIVRNVDDDLPDESMKPSASPEYFV